MSTETSEDGFALEAQEEKPVVKCCGTCFWFAWAVGPTGRRRKVEAGSCRWPVPWPKNWPVSFGGFYSSTPDYPKSHPVWCESGTTCQCWKRVEVVK